MRQKIEKPVAAYFRIPGGEIKFRSSIERTPGKFASSYTSLKVAMVSCYKDYSVFE
jgi:hypothetical protein